MKLPARERNIPSDTIHNSSVGRERAACNVRTICMTVFRPVLAVGVKNFTTTGVSRPVSFLPRGKSISFLLNGGASISVRWGGISGGKKMKSPP